MMKTTLAKAGLILVCLVASDLMHAGEARRGPAPTPDAPTAENAETNLSPQQRRRGRRDSGVYKASIDPHWVPDSPRFWYRNDLPDDQREYLLVDAEANTQAPLFDHQRLADALAELTGQDVAAARLPLEEIELSVDLKSVSFVVDDVRYSCDLDTYECTKWHRSEEDDQEQDEPRRDRRRQRRGSSDEAVESPDGAWAARINDHNVYLSSTENGDEVPLTDDGRDGHAYDRLEWAPDSSSLVAFQITPGDNKEVHLIESSPRGGGRARLHSRVYPLPGDRMAKFELHLFNPETKEAIDTEAEPIDFGWPRLHWFPDGHSFAYRKVDRGHQRFRVIRVDASTGAAKTLVDEKSETFIWTAHTENLDLDLANWLDESEELIYVSEQDGWRHLYLVDAKEGGIKHQITKGEYVVRGIDRIDEQERQIWFTASGKNPHQDPYFRHYYRVDFSGDNLVALTEGDGDHRVQFSPDRKYLIDTYSRVDRAPIHELRRCEDGSLVRELERADISELKRRGWRPLEVFHTKGRDDETDIWGVISLPSDFDPSKKYPVIENIYAGPQGSFVPKTFRARNPYASIAELGFVVVQIDGMGTANRSKAFHDVCWHNLNDAGFPDRIRWIKAAAESRPYMDLDRVGIYGGSAGGQNATAGLLFHPDFYKVGVSGCGCHDNRMDKASWNEQWMGYPVGPQYAECSNIDNADRLEGKLMLIVGEMDNNVPPESTLRLVDALIEADKEFEFVFVPGAGHGMGGSYGFGRLQDFFVRHLLGDEPQE